MPMRLLARRCGNQSVGWAFSACLLCLFAAFPAFAILPLTGGGSKAQLQKQVGRLEQQWRLAVLAGDTASMSALLAESYIGIGPDGMIYGKSQELQARSSGAEHLQELDVLDRKIRIYGTTAVVTSRVHVQGIYSGQALLGEFRYTRVWSLSHAQWHVVSFEANRVHDVDARSHPTR